MPPVQAILDLVERLQPLDALEERHRAETTAWLRGSDDVFRRAKPATPARHLVAYAALIDPVDGSSFLVHHRRAGRWLPPGGHLEPGEAAAAAASRETREELGIEPRFADDPPAPLFLTVTETVGRDPGHVDVSLWFVLHGQREMAMKLDEDEFTEGSWWTPRQLDELDPALRDPHHARFLTKLAA